MDTYIRFAIWFGIGLLMYFGYGMRMSGEHRPIDGQLRFMPCIEWKSKRREQMYAIKKEEGTSKSSDDPIIVAF